MPIFSWIRDLFGIQKDMYETKKTRLEIEKIEGEKREKLITPATFADVKKYDINFQKLIRRIEADSRDEQAREDGLFLLNKLTMEDLIQYENNLSRQVRRRRILLRALLGLILLTAISFIIKLILW